MAVDKLPDKIPKALAAYTLDSAIEQVLGWSLTPFLRLREERRQAALEALQHELRLGNISQDEFVADAGNVASVLRLLQCAEEGAARTNLRMLAQVIRNQHAHPAAIKDEFQRWAPILASLSREEIVFLGTISRCTQEAKAEDPFDSANHTAQALSSARAHLARTPLGFGAEDTFDAIASGLSQTSLILPVSAFGGISYKTTALFDRLAKLMSFEEFADTILNEDQA